MKQTLFVVLILPAAILKSNGKKHDTLPRLQFKRIPHNPPGGRTVVINQQTHISFDIEMC